MASPWAQLEAWLLFPFVLLVTAAGAGLLAERVCRVRLPGPLVVPLGLCVSIVVLMPIYKVGFTAPVGIAALLVVSVLGLLAHRRSWRAEARRVAGGWTGAVGLAVFGLYMAPAALTGNWTWAGYNFVNDTAFQFILTDWIANHGIPYVEQPRTTTSEVVRVYLLTAYPVGSHAHFGTLAGLVRAPIEVVYQSYLGGLVAIASMALFSLARRAGLPDRRAAVAAVVAAAASLTFAFALQGNIKEIAMLATLVTGVAIGVEAIRAERPLGIAICVSLAFGAQLSVYYAAAVPYVGVVAVLLAIATLLAAPSRAARVRVVVALAAAAVVFGVAALPAVTSVRTSQQVLTGVFASGKPQGEDLAQLVRPLPLIQGAGVWLAGDYRQPVAPRWRAAINLAGILLVLGLGAWAAVTLIRRREPWPLILPVAGVVVYLVLAPRTAPYADAKMLALLSPGVLLFGMLGALKLPRRLAVAAAAVIAALVFGSAAVAYHDVRLAPPDRMEDLADINDRYAGSTDLMLFNEFEEFAKYFLRDARINNPTEAITEAHIELRDRTDFGGRTFDVDLIQLAFVERYPLIVTRRKPTESRPPADYRLDYRNASYEVWRRVRGPRATDAWPLWDDKDADNEPECGRMLEWVATLDPSRTLVAARRPETATFDFAAATDRPSGWRPDRERPGLMLLDSAGSASGEVTVKGGRYRVWLEGSFGRPVELRVDGRPIGDAQAMNTPGGWLPVGTELTLTPGRHRVEVRRGSAGPAPGDGARSSLGGVAFVAPGEPELIPFKIADAGQLCGRQWDWVQAVAPEGS